MEKSHKLIHFLPVSIIFIQNTIKYKRNTVKFTPVVVRMLITVVKCIHISFSFFDHTFQQYVRTLDLNSNFSHHTYKPNLKKNRIFVKNYGECAHINPQSHQDLLLFLLFVQFCHPIQLENGNM